MKRSYNTIIRVILAACAMAIAAGYQSYAQVDINIKFIKKEARELKKKGYKPLPGYPSIENQLLFSHVSMSDYDSDGIPRYVLGGC